MKEVYIMVTGLPASGKTTIGRQLAQRLGVPFLDKDDYLESLYDKHGTGDRRWRQRLSSQSNEMFQADAARHPQAVLVSHWRPTTLNGPSGTPTNWLQQADKRLIELYCDCPVEVAAERFLQRKRHPGHLDSDRSLEQTIDWLSDYGAHLPLGIGQQITVQSNQPVQIDLVVSEIQQALAADDG